MGKLNIFCEKGQALLLTLLVMVLVMSITAALFLEVLTEHLINRNLQQQRALFYLAEAGIIYSIERLRQDPHWEPADNFWEIYPGQGFILNISGHEGGKIITSRGIKEGEELLLQVEVELEVNREPFQWPLVGAGDVELFLQGETHIDGLLALNSLILDTDKGSTLTCNKGLWTGGDVFLAEGVQVNCSCFQPYAGSVDFPQVDWTGLGEKALDQGFFTAGSWDQPIDFSQAPIYYISGDLTLTGLEQPFQGTGLIVVEGEVFIEDCFFSEDQGPVILLAGLGLCIKDAQPGSSFLGFLYSQGSFAVEGIEKIRGFCMGVDFLQGISIARAKYICNYWQTEEWLHLEEIFLSNRVKIIQWKEGVLP